MTTTRTRTHRTPTRLAGWETALVTISDDAPTTVWGQFRPADRWNGWLNPWIDAGAVVQVTDALNEANDPGDRLEVDWDGDVLVLTETLYADEPPARLAPDADGLYDLGGWAWVWHRALPVHDEAPVYRDPLTGQAHVVTWSANGAACSCGNIADLPFAGFSQAADGAPIVCLACGASLTTGPCAWWALCDHDATGTMAHPVLGEVPICDRCRANVEALA